MTTALIVCGALAREVLALRQRYGWDADVLGVPALLHNHPGRIPAAVLARIRQARERYDEVIVVYGDCGTSGRLDQLLAAEGVRRVAGPHCYEMYAGGRFEDLMAEELGTFFLTDYLVQSFDHLVLEGLGLDRYPELRDDYFGQYTRSVYLAQRDDPALRQRAQWAADCLKLPLEIRPAGYGALETRLVELMNLTPRPPSLKGKGVPQARGPNVSNAPVTDGASLLPPSFEGRGAGEVRSNL